MTAIIRRATTADAGAIACVHVSSWQTTYKGIVPQSYLDSLDASARMEMWEKEIAQGEASFFVAEEEGALCGFICGGRLREAVQDYDAEIYAMYVLAERQRRGIGTALMRALADVLQLQGLTRVLVWVLAENSSQEFYQRLGGKRIAEKPIEIGDTELLEFAYGWESINDLAHPG